MTANGVTVYGSEWPLSGRTEITLTPGNTIPVGPVINAGEIYQILPLGGRTLTRDGSPFLPSYDHLFVEGLFLPFPDSSLVFIFRSDGDGRFSKKVC